MGSLPPVWAARVPEPCVPPAWRYPAPSAPLAGAPPVSGPPPGSFRPHVRTPAGSARIVPLWLSCFPKPSFLLGLEARNKVYDLWFTGGPDQSIERGQFRVANSPARGRGSTGRGGNLVAPAPPQSQPGRTNRARFGFAGTTAHSSDHSPDGPRHQVPGMVDRGEVRDYADLAQLGYVTRARITQIMNLLHLAPDIQEQLLDVGSAYQWRGVLCERYMRQVSMVIGCEGRGESEDHVEVRSGQQLGGALLEPLGARQSLTLGTVAVPAGAIAGVRELALVAPFDHTAQEWSAAGFDDCGEILASRFKETRILR